MYACWDEKYKLIRKVINLFIYEISIKSKQ